MEYIIAASWFVAGLVIGIVGTISSIMFLGDREIKKRSRRSNEWQKVKKKMDSDFHDEYGV